MAHSSLTIIRHEHRTLSAIRMMGGTDQGEARRDKLEALMKQYADFYLEHMRIEEAEILPLAESMITPDEWAELDAAFLMNRDPLAGYEADAAFRPLFAKIVGTLQNSGNFGSA